MENKDVIIIGGGPAGLAAAVELRALGIADILILEREQNLGGILRQCIHDGFGLTRFRESLSGPEYAQRFIDLVEKMGIPYLTEATVIGITGDRLVTASTRAGILEFRAGAVVLAMGCRERTRGAVGIPGNRPAGVWTAGVAQSYINLHNTMVGKEVVILGSGDIGMIMARRFTLEGAKVKAVFEILPYPSGLPRNIRQCLEDYGIPLFLSRTVTDIKGRSRLVGVTVAETDGNMDPVPGTEKYWACDTLILSVGLIPENELSVMAGTVLDGRTKGPVVDENYRTSVPGLFAAGNVLQVHDLVDFVSLEAEKLAASVARYLRGEALPDCPIQITGDASVLYAIPHKISSSADFTLSLRVRRPFGHCEIRIIQNGNVIKAVKLDKAIPAEMIRIPMKASALAGTGKLEVSVLC
ncbi:MAG TPA: pyridine nucleotide-disulfide oxidoreductase [Treponema sp.]|nr:MAG: pyridine nucleotide-disulfide oxidoreductase [Treponema sp. GWC1_61_84]OHE71954.1 MAG: pyridine nucleotide-disulfide oxidoreductase [Treponema sp. RIFOXYC1_FULL_61_9]HCM28418.1 pyridine nucleotide-disulfide oxidoreductase [Treponema sp.]